MVWKFNRKTLTVFALLCFDGFGYRPRNGDMQDPETGRKRPIYEIHDYGGL